jgi:hypothetical protein
MKRSRRNIKNFVNRYEKKDKETRQAFIHALYVLAVENISKNQNSMEFRVSDINSLLPALNDSNIEQILYQNDTY